MTKDTKPAFFAPGLDTKTGSEEGRPMTVRLPDGTVMKRKDGEPVVIWLYGPDSNRYREGYRAYTRKVIAAQAEDDNYDPEPETLAFLASMTARWNVQLTDGTEAPPTPQMVAAFYDAFPVARGQVDTFMGKRSNFMAASSGD